MTAPTCPTCDRKARLTNGVEVYPHRPDLHPKSFWRCDGCGGYVGCHPGTTTALGTPANATLRRARSMLHDQRVDPLWKGRKVSRNLVYAYLAQKLGIPGTECHTGMFDLERCRAAWTALSGVTPADIRAWDKARKEESAACPAAISSTSTGRSLISAIGCITSKARRRIGLRSSPTLAKNAPIPHVLELAKKLWATTSIVFVSGRSDECRDATVRWLEINGFPMVLNWHNRTTSRHTFNLYMRRAGDHRPDNIVKSELLDLIVADGYQPIMAFDDRDQVVKMWRARGIPCAQVAEGNF